jgi:hypothetical protein
MSNKIFIITVFISNIAFGAILPIATIQKTITTKDTNRILKRVSNNLSSRGIERQIADKKVNDILSDNAFTTDMMAKNIIKNIVNVKENDIIAFLSQAALQGKKVDLSSYSTLIALVQQSSKTLVDADLVKKIEKLSNENERLKTQQVTL